MKFLDTKYPSLFDSSTHCTTDTTYNVIKSDNNSSGVAAYCIKNINNTITTTSIWVRFLCQSSGTTNNDVLRIRTDDASKNLRVASSQTQLLLTDSQSTFSWTIDVPSKEVKISAQYYYQRTLVVHFDTVQNIAEIYSDGIYYGSTACGNSGENISEVAIGSIGAASATGKLYYVRFADIIISENQILPTESVTEVTPTITSTDWTVSDGVASADNVGDSMTLTAPSGSIDETKRAVTGYGLAFFSVSPSETINALNITQGSATKQVMLSGSGAVETADTFTATQLSDISATAVAAYVS